MIEMRILFDSFLTDVAIFSPPLPAVQARNPQINFLPQRSKDYVLANQVVDLQHW
jgi:hypothetical protein